jgi:ATP-dependent Zn protease
VYLGTGEEHVFLGREITQDKSFSDATAQKVDTAVREIVENAQRRAIELNREHRDKLEALVAALLERETMDGPEVEVIFGTPGMMEDHEAGMEVQQPRTAAELSAERVASGEPDGRRDGGE